MALAGRRLRLPAPPLRQPRLGRPPAARRHAAAALGTGPGRYHPVHPLCRRRTRPGRPAGAGGPAAARPAAAAACLAWMRWSPPATWCRRMTPMHRCSACRCCSASRCPHRSRPTSPSPRRRAGSWPHRPGLGRQPEAPERPQPLHPAAAAGAPACRCRAAAGSRCRSARAAPISPRLASPDGWRTCPLPWSTSPPPLRR